MAYSALSSCSMQQHTHSRDPSLVDSVSHCQQRKDRLGGGPLAPVAAGWAHHWSNLHSTPATNVLRMSFSPTSFSLTLSLRARTTFATQHDLAVYERNMARQRKRRRQQTSPCCIRRIALSRGGQWQSNATLSRNGSLIARLLNTCTQWSV